jgi:hypothetical protein
VADTEIVTLRGTVEPLEGEVMVTTGGVVSGGPELLTLTDTDALEVSPRVSYAVTERVSLPEVWEAVFQENENGEEVAVAVRAPLT